MFLVSSNVHLRREGVKIYQSSALINFNFSAFIGKKRFEGMIIRTILANYKTS